MENLLLPILLPTLLTLFVILLVVMGRRAKARLVVQYPPPGMLVDVGGYQLHINALGERKGNRPAAPTVVMEAGRGEASLTWADVQDEVSKFCRVVTYDRAGLGWSERGTEPRTASNIVDELNILLKNAGEKGPFVLVGHSIGGLYARLYAQRHPKDVVGMVLVDSTHEDIEFNGFPRILDYCIFVSFARITELLSIVGLLPLIASSCGLRWPMPAPSKVQEAYAAIAVRDIKHAEACIDEVKNTASIVAEARASGMDTLGEIPLVVISSAPMPVPQACCSCLAGYVERANAQGAELHTKLASLSSQGRREIAEDSGHHVQVDRPDLVVDAIREVVEASEAELVKQVERQL